jgi:glycosyltransferase involved in cell wall biosynthesis
MEKKIKKSVSFLHKTWSRSVKMVSTSRWKPYSRLVLIDDNAKWVISKEVDELRTIVAKLKIKIANKKLLAYSKPQSVFYGSRYNLFNNATIFDTSHRLGTTYYHGRPGYGYAEFDKIYKCLCQRHERIQRIQVTHSEMRGIVLESGIDPAKVFLIPIGIDISLFPIQTKELCGKVRAELGIPETAIVIGSFQKDGAGWGEGNKPKLIKGPDIFLKTIEILQRKIPELFVLLSGPARGYVITGLKRLGIPYHHVYLSDYSDVGALYQTLDLYIVASRQEGGPKAVLESMASGVPLITTRVGQAMDLVQHKKNGWIVDVEDVEGLAYWAEHVIENRSGLESVLTRARKTAEKNAYSAQLPLWKEFMKGFVSLDQR